MPLGATEDGLVDFAIRILRQHRAQRAIRTHRATTMANRQETALKTIFVFNKMFRTIDELLPGPAGAEHLREIRFAENVAEKGFGITSHPAIALRDGALGINRDELVGTVFFPDARESCGRPGEMM